MDATAVNQLKLKTIKDFQVLERYLNKGIKLDYSLLKQEICVIENSDCFDNGVFEYLMTTTYE